MPGRLAIYDDLKFKENIFDIFGTFEDDIKILYKQYNIAPTINIPILTTTKKYTYAHFGLIPSWAKDRKTIHINARSETVFEKKSFRESYRKRRCIIPVNGYYEWEKDLETKESIPFLISSSKDSCFAFAGIYEYWYDNIAGKTITSCALLTTEPNEKIAKIHDRMPVVLEQKDWAIWLNDQSSFEILNNLYTPLSDENITITKVNKLVNSIKNDSASCIEKSSNITLIQNTLF